MTTSEWTTKVWGRTRCVHDSDVFSGHELEVKKLGYCSVHFHEQRANRFIVESGVIAVVVFWAWRHGRTILTAGDKFDVPSMVVHQFQVIQSGKVREDYWADRGGTVRKDDISRLCHGGTVEDLEQFKTLANTMVKSYG